VGETIKAKKLEVLWSMDTGTEVIFFLSESRFVILLLSLNE